MTQLKLPRRIETDPARPAIEAALSRDVRPLWERGTIKVAHVELSQALELALCAAADEGQLARGLENIERQLESEKRGLDALREKQGTAPANRVSRLLVMSDDGAERLYRACETILFHHPDRVLGLRVAASSTRLAEKLFGPDQFAKVLLVTEKDAVTAVLLSIR